MDRCIGDLGKNDVPSNPGWRYFYAPYPNSVRCLHPDGRISKLECLDFGLCRHQSGSSEKYSCGEYLLFPEFLVPTELAVVIWFYVVWILITLRADLLAHLLLQGSLSDK